MKKVLLTLAIAVWAACSFAQGAYIEFKMSLDGKDAGNMKLYMQDGNSRSDISIAMPQLPGGGMNISALILKGNEKMVYMLDDKAKTYTEHEVNENSNKEYAETEYEVTVIGKEMINGYNATHVKIVGKKYKTEQEMWTSTEVVNYEKYKSVRSKYTNDALFTALKAKGADGFPVRIKSNEQSKNIQLDLVKAESKTNPAALFSLSGYTKSDSTTPAGVPNMQDLMKQMQNMTPAEREEMIKKMKEQYQPK